MGVGSTTIAAIAILVAANIACPPSLILSSAIAVFGALMGNGALKTIVFQLIDAQNARNDMRYEYNVIKYY